MAAQTNCAMPLLSLPHTVQTIHLPASVFLVVGSSAFSSSHQPPVPLPAAPEKKLLLPPVARKIVSSTKKRTGKVSIAKDPSLPKRKRGRPRRDASTAAVANRSLAPRPILPRVTGGAPIIALAGQHFQELPSTAARKSFSSVPPIAVKNCSTTLLCNSNNPGTYNTSHATTSRSSIVLPSLNTARNFSASLKLFISGEERPECFQSQDKLQDRSCTKLNIPGNEFVKIIISSGDSSGSLATTLNSDDNSRSDFQLANPKISDVNEALSPELAICKIISTETPPGSTNSGTNQSITAFIDEKLNNGVITTERPKPLVIRSASSMQPAVEVDSGQTISVIRISTGTQSPSSTSSEMSSIKSLAKDSSTKRHCTSASSSVATKSLPVLPEHCNSYEQASQSNTSTSSVSEGLDAHTKQPVVNTTPTFSSFGIEHDEPLDPSIVQRLNERLNTGSTTHLTSFGEMDSEKSTSGKFLQQKLFNCSEINQFKLNESEETRVEPAPTTNVKGLNKSFLCQVCGKLLNGRSNLKSHLLTHSSARPHVCPVCDKAFRRRHTFQIHMRTHTNENPYTCGRCPAAFKTRSNLVRHEAVHTSRSRDYRCKQCGKEFTSRLGLNAHHKIHAYVTGPCECPQCGEVYATMQSLRTHQLHHKYPDKQFKCKFCDKAYVFQSLLKRHMDGHNGVQKFHCHLCSVTFAWKSSLAAHILTHYPKKFKCKLCTLSFNTEKRLVSHLKKHSEPNPHSCTLCLKKFPFRYLLVRHVKSAHGHRSFVTVKAKAGPRKGDMMRRIQHQSSGVDKGTNPSKGSQVQAHSEVRAQQYPGNSCGSLKAVTNSFQSAKPIPFPAVSQKIPIKFRCISAQREHFGASVPRFTVSIGQKSECPVLTNKDSVKQEHIPKYEPVCSPARETVADTEPVIVSSPADACNDHDVRGLKPPQPARFSSSYREPPPSYYSASPRALESFAGGSGDSPTSFRHSSTTKRSQSEHEPRSVSSVALDSYTPSYETFSSCKSFNDLQSPPSSGRYQRGPSHPNLLPASSDPYLQAASSTHSAYFPSPPQQPAYDSPSSRHPSACSSSHQAAYNVPPHLQPSYGSSSPSQQSHGGLVYLATHSEYDLEGCLDDEALPDAES